MQAKGISMNLHLSAPKQPVALADKECRCGRYSVEQSLQMHMHINTCQSGVLSHNCDGESEGPAVLKGMSMQIAMLCSTRKKGAGLK